MKLLDAWKYAINEHGPYKKYRRKNDVMRVYTEENQKLLIFAFDPSNDVPDWFSNIKFITEKEIRVCQKRFRKTIRTFLEKYDTFKPVSLGYSRGAALAIITAEFIAHVRNIRVVCWTMESPQILNKKSVMQYNNFLPITHIGIRNGNDPVAYLAPSLYHPQELITFPQPWYKKLPFVKTLLHGKKSVEAAIRKYGLHIEADHDG